MPPRAMARSVRAYHPNPSGGRLRSYLGNQVRGSMRRVIFQSLTKPNKLPSNPTKVLSAVINCLRNLSQNAHFDLNEENCCHWLGRLRPRACLDCQGRGDILYIKNAFLWQHIRNLQYYRNRWITQHCFLVGQPCCNLIIHMRKHC